MPAHSRSRSERSQSVHHLYMRAKRSLETARGSSSCRQVFDFLTDASRLIGRAQQAHFDVAPSYRAHRGKLSGHAKLRDAIDKLEDSIENTQKLYRDGGCIVGGSGTVSPGLSGWRSRKRKGKGRRR